MADDIELTQYQNALSNEGLEQEMSPEAYQELLTPTPLRGPVATTRYAGQGAMIQGKPYEPEVLDAMTATGDSKAEAQGSKDQYYNTVMQRIQDNISDHLESSADVLNEVIQASHKQVQDVMQQKGSELATETAYVKQAAPMAADDITTRKAQQVAVANDLADMTEAQGWLDTGLDILGYMVPFGELKDISDIPDEINNDPRLRDLSGENLETVMGAWKGLPVARQQELYPALKEAIIKATSTLGSDGNILKASDYLQKFFEVEGAEALRRAQATDAAISAVDFVPVGTVARVLKGGERTAAAAIMKQATQQVVDDTAAARIAVEAGDIETAAGHTVAAISDDALASSLGTNRVDAAQSAMPMQFGEWFTKVVNDDQLPSAVATRLDEAAAVAEGHARTMTAEQDLMQMGVMTASSRRQYVEDFFTKMEKKGEDYLTESLEMSNLKLTKEDSKGFSFSYELRDKRHPDKVQVRTGNMRYKISDVTGDYTATVEAGSAQNEVLNKALSPTAWSRTGKDGDFNAEVKRAIQADDLSAAYTARNAELLQWAAQPVTGLTKGKARQRVDAILQAGDEYVNPSNQAQGRTFTPNELSAGVETPNGTVRLVNEDEVEAYYRFRMYADAAYQIENQVLKRELELGGFKNVKMFSLSTPKVEGNAAKNIRVASVSTGKPYDDLGTALAGTREHMGQGVWDDVKGEVTDITDAFVRQAYDEGDVIVRLKQDWNTKGTGDLDASGEMVQFVRVRRDRVGDLPEQVLNYREGYVPKINEAKYVVSQKMPLIARGRPGQSRSQAVRAFDSLSDAQAFREEMIAKYMANHQLPRESAELFFPEPGRLPDMPFAQRLEESVGNHNGLYHGTRSKDQLLFGLSGQQLSRVSPMEAYQRHVNHLGTFQAQNEVRLARERRWLNTVRREFPEVKVTGFETTPLPSTPKGVAAERMRQQIRMWNGIPSNEESLFNAMAQRIHDWSLNGARNYLGFKDKESIKSMQWLMHTNPVSAVKAAVMHNLLGTFNIAQLYTQASAALVAITKNPRYGQALTQAAGFHVLDNIRDASALGKAYEMLKLGKVIDAETVEAHKAWLKTGLRDSVRVNADLSNVSSNGLGITNSVLRSASNLSLLPYRTGEMINRRITFLTEYKAWKGRTGKTTPSDLDLQDILEEANKDMLELGPANRAWWQGGQNTGALRQLLGMATQFMQVGTKMMELVFKNEGRGGFTLAQRRRILFGQTVMFGAAGVPLGGIGVQLAAQAFGVNELSEESADALNQGFVGFTTNMLLGSDLQISDRMAIGAQITQMTRDFITSSDPIVYRAFGPAGSGLFGRIDEAYGQLKVLALSDATGRDELTTDRIKLGFAILSEIPSTGRNYWKYRLMTNSNQIVDRSKNTIIERDFDLFTEGGVLIGFQPSAQTEAYVGMKVVNDVEDQVRDYADARIALMHNAIYKYKLDPETMSAVTVATQMIDSTTPDYIKEKGLQRVAERIYGSKQDSLAERNVKKFLEITAPEKITEDAILEMGGILSKSDAPFTRTFKQILDTQDKGDE